ncbi:6537_t:CDS:2, partial [Ambispora gerdemannii]
EKSREKNKKKKPISVNAKNNENKSIRDWKVHTNSLQNKNMHQKKESGNVWDIYTARKVSSGKSRAVGGFVSEFAFLKIQMRKFPVNSH